MKKTFDNFNFNKDLLHTFIIKDKKTLNLLNKTILFSFAICLLGILLIHLFLEYGTYFKLFEASIIIFRTCLFVSTSSIMSAIIINDYNNT